MTLYLLLGVAILGVALWLRVQGATERQFHADEGVQAFQAWRLIKTGAYRYDSREHHGPTLYYVTKWLSPLLKDGEGRLSDFSIRLVPLTFSLLTVAGGLLALARLAPMEALIWAAIAAIAPIGVIYGGYYVQESLLAFFTLCSLYLFYRYVDAPTLRGACFLGLAWGAMHVTKETAIIHGAASIVAASVLLREAGGMRCRLELRQSVKHLAAALGTVAVLHVIFFSSFGTNMEGVIDGALSYFNYAQRAEGQGHEKAFTYYLGILWPHTRGGIQWGELAFLVAVATGVFCLIKPASWQRVGRIRFVRFTTCFGLVLLALYMAIPYKTPWLMLTPYLALSLTAAFGVVELWHWGNRWSGRWRLLPFAASMALGLWVLMDLASVSRWAVLRFPSAERNPYLYQHTTSRYHLLVSRLEALRSSSPDAVSAGVFSPDAAWPLPWHLREWTNVGYWRDLRAYEPHDIDVIDTRLTGDALPGSDGNAVWELYGLRPNTLLALRIDGTLFEQSESEEGDER